MFDRSYKAAVVQMNSQKDLKANFEQAYGYIASAAKEGALIAGIPEYFAFLGGMKMRIENAGEIAEITSKFLSETAAEFEIYLLGGSYPVPASEGKVFNHATLYNPEGRELISYDKVHLFDVDLSSSEAYRESDYIEPGSPEPAVHKDQTIGNWGLSVCYDLRFPEFYRKLIDQGAEILTVPSAFTYTTGKDHWEALLRARAIENTAYVFAPAQTGFHGKDRKTWGHAMIVDPWGKIIADAGSEPGIAYGEINPARLKEVRKKMPSLKHRRW